MEFFFLAGFVLFVLLSIVLLIIIVLEYRELKSFRDQFNLLALAISETAEVVNRNAESARQETTLVREIMIETSFLKQILDIHGKALSYTMPNKQFEELLEAIKKMEK